MPVVEEALSRLGLSRRDFVVEMAREVISRRKPESQGGVKITVDGKTIPVDMDDIEAAVEAVEEKADLQHRIGATFTDRALRARYRQSAGRYHNASMFLHQILQAGARRRDGEVVHRSRGHKIDPGKLPPDIRASLPSTGGVN